MSTIPPVPDSREAAADDAARRRAIADIVTAHAAMRAEMAQEAEDGVALAHQNVIADIEASGLTLPELADRTGLGLHHLANVVDGRDELTVTGLCLLGMALGRLPGDWLPALEGEFEISPAVTVAAAVNSCASYCPTKDGHPDEPLAEDKVCWAPDPLVAPLSLHPSPLAPNPAYAETMARRKEGQDVVHMHIETRRHDVSFDLTPEEARRLARCLVAVAEQVEQEVVR
ncbi:hypothetical protein [Nocardia sp. CA-290969]|uniref:hypothetical protein n=1 Tax=Nocardia sp. CA-290969 TaxID=3239986 RepID=UPI003D8D00B8